MTEIIKQKLPWGIDENELKEIQARAALRRKIQREIMRQMGELPDRPKLSFAEFRERFPKCDIEDDEFLGYRDEAGARNVHR